MNFNLDTDHEEEVGKALMRVLASRQYINGDQLRRFEREWAEYNGIRHAVGVGSGTDALRIALIAAGVRPGDEVISPVFNVGYTAQAVRAIGAVNVFVDVDPKTWLIDIDKIGQAVGPKTKAIVPVHLFGLMADMDAIAAVARTYGLVVIEDAAQAHGASYLGHAPGRFSDAACYSHYPTKNLGCLGEGGSITTRLPFIAEQARYLRDAGRTDRYVHMMPGVNSILDEIQAAVLLTKLPYLAKQNAKRRKIVDYYEREFAGLVETQYIPDEAYTVRHLYVIKAEARPALMARLKHYNVPCLAHYPCTLDRQPFAVSESLDQGPFPVGEELAKKVLSLPLFPGMTDIEVETVVKAVRSFYGANY